MDKNKNAIGGTIGTNLPSFLQSYYLLMFKSLVLTFYESLGRLPMR